MFFAFLLSILASFFGIKTLNDFKNKARLAAILNSLHFDLRRDSGV